MLSALLRVGGIGDGLFVIFFFLGISVLLCIIGARTERPGLFFVVAIALSLFIILFMILVPKAPPGGEPSDEGVVYDQTSKFRTGAAVVIGISLGIAILAFCGQIVMMPIQGSRIRTA